MLHVRLAEERQTKHQRGKERGNTVVLLFFTFSLIFLFVCFKKDTVSIKFATHCTLLEKKCHKVQLEQRYLLDLGF